MRLSNLEQHCRALGRHLRQRARGAAFVVIVFDDSAEPGLVAHATNAARERVRRALRQLLARIEQTDDTPP